MRFLATLWRDESGATAIEYGLIVAILSVGVISTMQSLGTQLGTTMQLSATALSSANS